jgi:2-polyprenyl-6-methoxyphenol hydroxylase-like FAD-dependent oxidoreductase
VTNATEPVSVTARTTAIVVGGSLTGLAAAIALGHCGVAVTVLERSTRLMTEFGAGLGIDLDLLGSLVPAHVATLPVVGPGRLSTSWLSLYQLLRSTAQASPLVTYRQAARVIEVSDAAGQATATLDSGETLQADLIVGADGYRSLVRRFVDPGHPDAEYAGNLLWRGVLDEHDVPPHAVHETLDAGLAVHRSHGLYLVTYRLRHFDEWLRSQHQLNLTELHVLVSVPSCRRRGAGWVGSRPPHGWPKRWNSPLVA